MQHTVPGLWHVKLQRWYLIKYLLLDISNFTRSNKRWFRSSFCQGGLPHRKSELGKDVESLWLNIAVLVWALPKAYDRWLFRRGSHETHSYTTYIYIYIYTGWQISSVTGSGGKYKKVGGSVTDANCFSMFYTLYEELRSTLLCALATLSAGLYVFLSPTFQKSEIKKHLTLWKVGDRNTYRPALRVVRAHKSVLQRSS